MQAAAFHGLATNPMLSTANRLASALQALDLYAELREQENAPEPENELQTDLAKLLNRHGAENGSGTPDFVLADYLIQCLKAFDYSVRYIGTLKP